MNAFISGHAAHADWRAALALAATQIDGGLKRAVRQRQGAPTLGFVYFTDHYAAHAEALLDALRQRWPGLSWVGCVGVGVAASGVEYFDEPALTLLLATLPREQFQVFSGTRALARDSVFSALVHADPATPDLAELLPELSQRTQSGYLFGGLAAARGPALHIADGAWRGGMSGVGFTQGVRLLSRVTQGCQPIGPVRHISAAEGNVVLALDGEPALACLLRDLGGPDPRALLPALRGTLVGLSDETQPMVARGGQFGADTRVRHLIGLDPSRRAVAVADQVRTGMRLAFCSRDAQAARRDLVRICSEIRDELSPEAAEPATAGRSGQPATLPQAHGGARARAKAAAAPAAPATGAERIAGALYVSCAGRGGPHFGAPSAELRIIRHALGDVPLAGFFAGGEIARQHLYGYTGVLTVFTRD